MTAFEYHKNSKAKAAKREEVDKLRTQGENLVRVIDDQKMQIALLEEEI